MTTSFWAIIFLDYKNSVGDNMGDSEKFIVRSKKVYGENTVVSCRMPMELVKRLDDISNKTGRARNELILRCVEFALDKLEIVDDE